MNSWLDGPMQRLVVVHVDRSAVADLVVLQRDVVLEDAVPPLQPDLVRPRARVGRDQLLEVLDRIGGAAKLESTSTSRGSCCPCGRSR
jgi:hypothetical protein